MRRPRRGLRRDRGSRVGARCRRRECRRPAVRSGRAHRRPRSRRVAPHDRHQPDRHVPHGQARGALDAAPWRRIDHPDRKPDRRERRGQGLHRLQLLQSRHARPRPHRRGGICRSRHPGEHGAARVHRDNRSSRRSAKTRHPAPRSCRASRSAARARRTTFAGIMVYLASEDGRSRPSGVPGRRRDDLALTMTLVHESRAWASGPWSLALRDDELADISYDAGSLLRSIRAGRAGSRLEHRDARGGSRTRR